MSCCSWNCWKSLLTLIERSQNTQSIRVCCTAADRSGCPCWSPSTTQSATYHLPKYCCRPFTPFHGNSVSWWQWCVFSRIMRPTTKQKLFINHLRSTTMGFRCWSPNSLCLIPIQNPDVLDKQVRSMVPPSHNLQDLKDLKLISWCQIPHYTFSTASGV